MKKPVTVTIL